MTDARAVAIRFADLWAVDHHQMVDEIYAPNIEMESMAVPGRGIRGIAQLHDLEDELARRVPQHRHELVRVLAAGSSAFLETTVVSTSTRQFSQAAVWWELDDHDQVFAEIGWFDWSHRTEDTRRSHGSVPADDRRPRGPAGWYEELIKRLTSDWLGDAPGAVERSCAPGCTADLIGRRSLGGKSDIAAGAAHVAASLPGHHVEVLRVLAEGGVIAVLLRLRYDRASTRGTVVLTLDGDDRIVGVRIYLDWATAVADSSPERES